MIASLLLLALGGALGYLLASRLTAAKYAAALAGARTAQEHTAARLESVESHAGLESDLVELLGPLAAGVRDLRENLTAQERERIAQLTRLDTHLAGLGEQGLRLQETTSRLHSALHSPTRRGQWGEVQLRRIVEYAGLLPRVDFDEQSRAVLDGSAVRPDMVVHLPGDAHIVVDAKAPIADRLDSIDASGDDTAALARALGRHIDALASKEYWKAFSPAPAFVVCFVPSDGLLATANAGDPGLVDRALAKNVVLASPSTLLVLLKTVALNWRQHDLSHSAQRVLELGTELYDRVGTLGSNLGRVGSSLDRAVTDYNRFLASFESRFLVTARKFPATGISDKELDIVAALDQRPRGISAAELATGGNASAHTSSRGDSLPSWHHDGTRDDSATA